jgi:hypothetical protein
VLAPTAPCPVLRALDLARCAARVSSLFRRTCTCDALVQNTRHREHLAHLESDAPVYHSPRSEHPEVLDVGSALALGHILSQAHAPDEGSDLRVRAANDEETRRSLALGDTGAAADWVSSTSKGLTVAEGLGQARISGLAIGCREGGEVSPTTLVQAAARARVVVEHGLGSDCPLGWRTATSGRLLWTRRTVPRTVKARWGMGGLSLGMVE